MAGKRLLDAAKILQAGSSVAKNHYALRQQQWEVYTKTSLLAKAVKSQTDRVTVTIAAARALAGRFAEKGEQRQEPGHERDVGARSRGQTGEDKIDKTEGWAGQRHGDNLARSAKHEEAESVPNQPLKDAAVNDDPAVEDNRAQMGAENVAPATDTPVDTSQSAPLDTGSSATHEIPQVEANGNAESQPDGINTDVFSSPRVSRMLGQLGHKGKNPYAGRKKLPPQPLPEMVAARERWQREGSTTAKPLATDTGTQSVEEVQPSGVDADAETQKLAAEISKEAESMASAPTPDRPSESHYEMRQSRVPSSRFGRLWQYGGLATSMAFGAVGESFRRITGSSSTGSLMLSEANMSRLVSRLSRMRGAALKLGQMISFQDSKVLPPTINAVLQRVQDSADYMPPFQRDQVLIRNLGQDWRQHFSEFEEKPFAAASIGQVHKAKLASNGEQVAVKIQYPGVRNSIDSDLNNLSLLLTASRLLPKGLYLEKTIANARVELGWECDYEREAKACIRFRELLADEESTFAVPRVYTEVSGPDVLTAEFMTGTGVTKIKDLTQDERDWIGSQILRLCLRELMEWNFMQTDPNWTNFLYNRRTKKLELLDFGASRDFPRKFVEPYVSLLIAASKNDREACRDLSIELGYLTGSESQAMLKAHVDSILTLAEPFVESAPDVYDFEDQTITDRVRANIGLMLRERMSPPPEETYSLHRKLSGAFLLCARLKSKVRAREMFERAVRVWEGRERKVGLPE